MITIFTVPKPFKDNIGIIQKNAIRSWLQLRPKCEVLLLGNEQGTTEAAESLGVQQIPQIEYNKFGTPLVNSVFDVAQGHGSHKLMAYVNADIILMSDFIRAVSRLRWTKCVMSSRRWDLDVTDLINFEEPDWEVRLQTMAVNRQRIAGYYAIDYFVFPRGLWGEIPPFALGRTAWDNWLMFRARALRVPLIDATRVVTVVHQDHDYLHVPSGKTSVAYDKLDNGKVGIPSTITEKKAWEWSYKGVESERNRQLSGEKMLGFLDATWSLTPDGLQRNTHFLYLRRRISTLAVLHPSLRPLFKLVRWFLRSFKR
jgi:hypothetical protein